MEKPLNIVRRSAPTKLDTAPKGSICTVSVFPEMRDGEMMGITETKTYIQMNKDESDPSWKLINT